MGDDKLNFIRQLFNSIGAGALDKASGRSNPNAVLFGHDSRGGITNMTCHTS